MSQDQPREILSKSADSSNVSRDGCDCAALHCEVRDRTVIEVHATKCRHVDQRITETGYSISTGRWATVQVTHRLVALKIRKVQPPRIQEAARYSPSRRFPLPLRLARGLAGRPRRPRW